MHPHWGGKHCGAGHIHTVRGSVDLLQGVHQCTLRQTDQGESGGGVVMGGVGVCHGCCAGLCGANCYMLPRHYRITSYLEFSIPPYIPRHIWGKEAAEFGRR